jgi:hypothetical protein
MTDHDYNPNLISEITEWVNEAVANYGQGERIQYAVSQVVIPTQKGMAPALALSMTLPGLVLGEVAQSFGVVALLGNTRESIDDYVRSSIDQMRNERSSQAAQVNTTTEGKTPVSHGGILL